MAEAAIPGFVAAFGGRSAVVTGAAAGIGLALAKALLAAGGKVVLADCDGRRLAAEAEALARHGDRAVAVEADVTDAAAVQRMVDTAVTRFGRLDYLFNNAGIAGALPIDAATLDTWRRLLDVNLWSVVHGIDAALPVMRRQGSGHIVNVASISGLVPFPGQALYVTSKHAVVGLSESLRHELADDGIAVSVVCPGPVATDIWRKPLVAGQASAPPPPGTITVETAVRDILRGVARRQGLIVLPAASRWQWRLYRWWPTLADRLLRAFARLQRRSAAMQVKATDAAP